jgi:putative nucleotidyltransferase with HDIG domain
VYIGVLLVLTVSLATLSLASLSFSPGIVLIIVIFALAVCIADLYPIVLPFEGNAELTVSCAFNTVAAITFGPYTTIIIALVGTTLAEVILRRTWYKTVFNTAQITLTFATMSLAYELLYDGVRVPFHSLQNTAAMGCMLLIYFLLNTGLVATIVSLSTGTTFVHIWRTNLRALSWNDLTVIPLGAVMAMLWDYRPWSIFALLLPLAVVRQSFQFVNDLQRQTREALISMADAIDRRDGSTYQHSQRVATLAEAIAQQLDLPMEEVEMVRMAARLHDVGKIGMSNALLFKPGAFDARELAEFRQHPLIGADLVKSFRLFNQGHDLILYHHERYDGKGYPSGLAGENIPLGSRILAVADSLDAMTAQRVYRAPVPLDEAVAELVRNKGTQFDPEMVEAFLRALERWGGKLPWSEERTPSR